MRRSHPIFKRYSCNEEGILYGVNERPLKTMLSNATGYKTLTVREAGVQKQYRAHRFIFECIHQREIKKDYVINHIDGNKQNNHPSNLEEVTSKQNTHHAFALGLMTPMVGEENGMSTITADTVRSIIRDIMSDEYATNILLGKKYGLKDKHISLIRHKTRWKFIFEEPEFRDYTMPKSKLVTKENTDRMLKVLHYINTTSLPNTTIGRIFGVDQATVSRARNGLLWQSAIEKYKQESSTTIENLFTQTELVEYSQVAGSSFLSEVVDDMV